MRTANDESTTDEATRILALEQPTKKQRIATLKEHALAPLGQVIAITDDYGAYALSCSSIIEEAVP